MIFRGSITSIWRGALAVTCAYVLLLQLVASGVAGTTHVAAKLTIGEIGTSVICGPGGGASADPSAPAHIEGTNTCCVWGISGWTGIFSPPPAGDQSIRYAGVAVPVDYGETSPVPLKVRFGRANASRAPPALG